MDGPEITIKRTLPLMDSLESMKEASRLSGGHFFDPQTMRGFGSRLAPDFWPLAGGMAGIFITSEQDRRGFMGNRAWDGARRYTVRVATFSPSGVNLTDAGPYEGTNHGFGAFATLAQARSHAKKCAKAGTPERAALQTFLTSRRAMNGWPVADLGA